MNQRHANQLIESPFIHLTSTVVVVVVVVVDDVVVVVLNWNGFEEEGDVRRPSVSFVWFSCSFVKAASFVKG